MVMTDKTINEISSFLIPGKRSTFTRKINRDANINSKLINLSG